MGLLQPPDRRRPALVGKSLSAVPPYKAAIVKGGNVTFNVTFNVTLLVMFNVMLLVKNTSVLRLDVVLWGI